MASEAQTDSKFRSKVTKICSNSIEMVIKRKRMQKNDRYSFEITF